MGRGTQQPSACKGPVAHEAGLAGRNDCNQRPDLHLGEPCPERRSLQGVLGEETLGFVGSGVSLSTHPLSSP